MSILTSSRKAAGSVFARLFHGMNPTCLEAAAIGKKPVSMTAVCPLDPEERRSHGTAARL